jgi:FkbM family methyltransferase
MSTLKGVIYNYSTPISFRFGKRTLRLLKSILFHVLLSYLKFNVFVIRLLPFGYDVSSKFLESLWGERTTVNTPQGQLIFQTPTSLNKYRARTLLTKEPETILWLNEIPKGAHMWDIGANVGIYSVYAAVFRECKVVAVEPSNLNLDLLFRNIQNNKCEEKVTILPLPVGAKNSQDFLFMSRENLLWGGAHNSVGVPINQSGTTMLNPVKSLQIVATMDQLVMTYLLPQPSYIKIDVDGLELEVLEGAISTLNGTKSILIEIDLKNAKNNILISQFLSKQGFKQRKSIGNIILTENQIWDKN